MPKLWIARRAQRKGLLLETQATKENPNLMFFLPGMDDHHLDQFVRSELAKQGITKESELNKLVERSEKEYERRVKTEEAIVELRRLMALRAEGKKLMQVGHRKWKEAWYRPIPDKET